MAVSSRFYKTGILSRLQCKRTHSFTLERKWPLFLLLEPASCPLVPELLVPLALGPPGSREAGSAGWSKPQGPSPTQMRRALILPSGSSDVRLLFLGKRLGREPVEKGLSVRSGNGRIWKHLPMCTDGRATAHKRLLFRVK